jgi:Ras-related GTP-binding protein C/D
MKANRWTCRYLALICLMRKENIEKQGLVEFNIQVFQEALGKVFALQR